MYDINQEGVGYSAANEALTDRIKELFGTRWHHLDSTWIVVTDMTAKAIRDDLKKKLDKDDELLVVNSGGEGAWSGFNDAGSKWLLKHL
jgi:hypothetical protein